MKPSAPAMTFWAGAMLLTTIPGWGLAQSGATPTGTVLHYVKTNLDGSRPEQIAVYVAGESTVEVFKYHPGRPPAGLVTARFDWQQGSLLELRSVQRRSATESLEVASFDYDPGARTGVMRVMGQESEVRFSHPRFSVYAFEMTDLNLLLQRRPDPTAPLEFMLVDLAYAAPVPTMYERGVVRLRYEGRDTRHGEPVWRYRLDGPGLEGAQASLWVNMAHGHIAELESPLANHPDWTSYRLRLERVSQMTAEAWAAFQVSQLQP